MTASKILSLWSKHGEQEQEMERLDAETKALQREAGAREEAEVAALSPAAAGGGAAGGDDDEGGTATLEAREAALASACAAFGCRGAQSTADATHSARPRQAYHQQARATTPLARRIPRRPVATASAGPTKPTPPPSDRRP